MNKHIELGKKLKALADKGVGGEKENAEVMLNALLKKHNITIEDIEGEKIEEYFVQLENNQARLWMQIARRVNYSIKFYGEISKEHIEKYRLKGNYMISCTASEYIEIQAKYNFYSRLYDEEVAVFYRAFLRTNDLEAINPNKKDEDSEVTMEQYIEWKRINDMAQGITKGQYRKQLTNGK